MNDSEQPDRRKRKVTMKRERAILIIVAAVLLTDMVGCRTVLALMLGLSDSADGLEGECGNPDVSSQVQTGQPSYLRQ
jgi:hypothetical protein